MIKCTNLVMVLMVLMVLISYPSLLKIVKFKREKQQKTETFSQQEKHKLIQMETFDVKKNRRISIYRSIRQ